MRQQRQEVIRRAHQLANKGWVANHDGNVSVKLGANRYLATPTATAKADVNDKLLIEVDGQGKKVAGTARPFSEMALHLAVYEERADVGAVLHAHPPYATALACSGSTLIERPFLPEAIVSLGPSIPTVPLALPGPDAVAAVKSEARRVDVILMENHGVLSWGSTLELAYLRMELVEHLAKIATLAQATGGVRPLPDSFLPKLLASRAKAGLGAAADRAMDFLPKKVAACAPAPHAPGVQTVQLKSAARTPPRNQLADIIREELARVLKS